MTFARAERVSVLVKKNLSEILHKHIHDPRLKNTTITDVNMSSDIKLAKIYFVTESKKKNDAMKGFKSAQGFIKRSLAKTLGLRYMPNLKFYYDESFDYGDHIEKLLKEVL
jgi:ribosome-binding factor A